MRIDPKSQATRQWTPEDCPVVQESEAVLKTADDLSRRMKRIAKTMRKCQSCQAAGVGDAQYSCPVLVEFNTQIERAILDLNREWGILP